MAEILIDVAINAAISIGLSYASRMFAEPVGVANTVSKSQKTLRSEDRAREAPVKQAVPPRRMIFGEVVTSGPLFIYEADNPHLYMGIALCEGPIQAIDAIIMDGKEYDLKTASGAVGNKAYPASMLIVEKGLGGADQSASKLLVDAKLSIGETFRQRKVARVVCKMHYGNNGEQHNELWGSGFNPSFRVRGAKIYDPRDKKQSQTDATTWKYSDNAVLCLLHYMTHAWGAAMPYEAFDLDNFKSEATICDQIVEAGGDVRKRYTLAGVVTAETPVADVVSAMLTACGGVLIYSDGFYRVHVDRPRDTTLVISDDDIVGGIEVDAHDAPIDASITEFACTYFDSDGNGRPDTTPRVVLQSTQRKVRADYDLPFTPDGQTAQRLGYMQAQRSRAGKRIRFMANDRAAFLVPRDVIEWPSSAASYLSGKYEVQSVDMAEFGVVLSLQEYPEAAYTDPRTYVR